LDLTPAMDVRSFNLSANTGDKLRKKTFIKDIIKNLCKNL